MKTRIQVPEVAENVSDGTVVSLLAKTGDEVAKDQNLIELETDKAVVGIPSPVGGKLVELLVNEGDTLKVGDDIAVIEASDNGAPPKPEPAAAPEPESKPAAAPSPEPAPAAKPAPAPTPAPTTLAAELETAPASPAVRRLARRLGVELVNVRGTGAGGRISADDVQDHVQAAMQGGLASAPGAASAAPLPDLSKWGPVRREPLSQVRQITARTMTQAWTTIPQVTQSDRADVTELETFRKAWNAKRPEGEPAMTMTSILLRVCAEALVRFPQFGASLDSAANALVYRDYRHIGVAVDTERGLLVPVVRDAESKGIARIGRELDDLAQRARAKRIGPDEMEGGVFTISNLGGIGGTNFSPIVYPPQVAILGVSRAARAPLWRGEGFEPRLMMPLDLSYDHRVIDGADAARFLRWICAGLEQPLALLV